MFFGAEYQPALPRLNPTTTWAPPPPRNPPERLVAELDPQRLLTPVVLFLKAPLVLFEDRYLLLDWLTFLLALLYRLLLKLFCLLK